MTKGGRGLLILLTVSIGFFVLPKFLQAATADHLVISQVQITGGTGQTTNDFVEIYNPTSLPLDLNGYRLVKRAASSTTDTTIKSWSSSALVPAHGFYLWANSNYSSISVSPDVTTTQSIADNNGIALRFGVENTGTIIDAVGWGTAANGLIEGNVFSQNPEANQSIERKPGGEQGNGEDSNNNSQDFLAPAASHPRNSQSAPQPPIQQGPVCDNDGICEAGEDLSNCPADCQAPSPPPSAPTPSVGDLVINEFLPSPVTGQPEWIELYNNTPYTFDLKDWKIYDNTSFGGSGNPIATLTQSISANGFLVIESVNKLNNGGDIIILKNSLGQIFDQVAYGDDENDGNLDDNAIPHTASAVGNSVARFIDGQDTNIDNQDFAETITPTRGSSNIITVQTPPPPSTPSDSFSASDVVINEFLPNPAEGKEWIEFYLNKNSDINLDSWKVYDNTANVILTLTGSLTTASRFAVFELSSRLNNDGDIIILKDSNGTLLDQVAYGNWQDGNLLDNAPVPAKAGQSVARASNGVDSSNDKNDFLLSDSPTKGAANIISQTEILSGSSDNSKLTYTVPKPLILINEFVPDPTDGEEEWVEIYNAGEVSVDLSGWYLEEGSKSKTEISGTSIPGQFNIISPIKGNLNNNGDIIFLKDNQGNIFDQVACGSWQDGNLLDNAPSASDPNSVARLSDGYSSNNPSKDFFIASAPTKGKSNGQEQSVVNSSQAKIIINELWPNPSGDDEQEFIELKNLENFSVCLNSWQIKDESARHYVLNNVCLPANGLAILKRNQTSLALNNDKDSVTLFNVEGNVKDKVSYQNAKENLSFSRGPQEWAWTSQVTPGKENIFVLANHAPQAVINTPSEVIINQAAVFDAGDSSDEDDDTLSYNWTIDDKNFNSEVVHYIFNTLGEHTVKIVVNDSKENTTQELKVFVAAKAGEGLGKNLLISEIFPNPAGSDSAEWVEIYNKGETPVDLTGFKIDDDEGGSRPYVLDGLRIEPKAFLVLERAQTKIAFNNDADSARLFDSVGHLLDSVSYGKVLEGLSFSRQLNGHFVWTTPSKNTANNKEILADELGQLKSGKKSGSILEVSLSQARQEDIGETIKTQGVVSVTPDLFGKQIFYLSGSGIQVYMSKADFPELKIGDLVQVQGELGEAQGERRIKISDKDGIKVIKNGPAPVPKEITAGEIGEENEGYFVSIAGNVSEINGRQITLDNDGAEAVVYLKTKTGLTAQMFSQGADVRVKGILSHNTNGYQILPRFKEDIEVIGTLAVSVEETLFAADKKAKTRNYLAVTFGGAMSLLLVVGLRRRLWNLFPFNSVAGFFRDRQKR